MSHYAREKATSLHVTCLVLCMISYNTKGTVQACTHNYCVQHVHIQHTSMWLHKYGTCHQLLSEYSQYAIELLVESVLLYSAGVWGCGGQLGPVEKYRCGQLEFLGEWGAPSISLPIIRNAQAVSEVEGC